MTLKTGGMAIEKVILKFAIIFHDVTVLFLTRSSLSKRILFIIFIFVFIQKCIIGKIYSSEF